MLGYEIFGRFSNALWKFEGKIWIGYEFSGEKIVIPSAPVPGINNDQLINRNFTKHFFLRKHMKSFENKNVLDYMLLSWTSKP